MTSLLARVAVIAIALALCACDDGSMAPDGPFTPGISGAPLAGRLEVIVVDEETHERVPSAELTVLAPDTTVLATRDAPGFAVLEDARITGAVSVRVVTTGSWEGTTTWAGVAAERVVIPVSRTALRTIEGRVLGADTLGAADVVVGPLDVPRFTSFGALDRAVSGACAPAADGTCHFSAVAGDGASRVAATVRDASGVPIAFGIGELSGDRAIDISLLEPSMRAPVVVLELGSSLPAPPAGLDAVVGVPGLAIAEKIRFLPQTPAIDGALGVPELAGSLAGASWWVLLEARSSAAPESRSVVLQRGIRDVSGVLAFAGFLELPSAVIADGVVQLSRLPGASMFALECDDDAPGVHTLLVFDAASALVGEGCDAVRVRAIDAHGASGSALDLEEAERSAQRFSEITITR